jgi:hypothetical protein
MSSRGKKEEESLSMPSRSSEHPVTFNKNDLVLLRVSIFKRTFMAI